MCACDFFLNAVASAAPLLDDVVVSPLGGIDNVAARNLEGAETDRPATGHRIQFGDRESFGGALALIRGFAVRRHCIRDHRSVLALCQPRTIAIAVRSAHRIRDLKLQQRYERKQCGPCPAVGAWPTPHSRGTSTGCRRTRYVSQRAQPKRL